MDIKLLQALRKAFTNNTRYYSGSTLNYTSSAWLSVDLIDNEVNELPVFALGAFKNIDHSIQDIYTLAIELCFTGTKSYYKSLNAAIRQIMETKYEVTHLIKIPCKEENLIYYATTGAIFDRNFKPILLATWKIEYEYPNPFNKEERKIKFIQPILRVSPNVIIDKSNSVERFIVNNIIPTTLQLHHVSIPDTFRLDSIFASQQYDINADVKVIIESMPFSIKHTDTPSISTTNEELLKVAFDNIAIK